MLDLARSKLGDVGDRMDSQYRFQRYIYDLSRKYYLIGRDSILDDIGPLKGATLLEVGCGTARNLCILAKRYPDNSYYGLDASQAMLAVAEKNITKANIALDVIQLHQGYAQELTNESLGGRQSVNHILFSYTLSMIPDWSLAIDQAVNNLQPGGHLHIVDFSDQASMPGWFKKVLNTWLSWFHVSPETAILTYLQHIQSTQGGVLTIKQTWGRYAFIAHYQKFCQ